MHLVEEVSSGRFILHDLLRLYALERLEEEESAEDRARARLGLLDFLAGTASTGDRLLNPIRVPAFWITRQADRETSNELLTASQAFDWFTAEHRVLVAELSNSVGLQYPSLAYELAWGLVTFLDRAGHRHDYEIVQRIALNAARLGRDARGEAYAQYGLGRAHTWRLDHVTAQCHFLAALELFTSLGDEVGQAQCHRSMAWSLALQDQVVAALEESEIALALFRANDVALGLAEALNAVGWFRAQLGNPHTALPLCLESLDLHQRLGNREGEADTLDSLGFIHHQLGNIDSSVDFYKRSLAAWHDISDHYYEATTLVRLGHAYEAGGYLDLARSTWTLARSAFMSMGHSDAEQVTRELERIGPPEP
jgi:tetratricopeptide (TPR) repeat protein